jgi:iron(III) transport system ATP-binding protein
MIDSRIPNQGFGTQRMAKSNSHTVNRGPVGVSFAAKLVFENISHKFDRGGQILNNVSLTAEPGEVLCLLGPSGSGKTTLLRIAAGIEVQSSGRILLNDEEIAGPSAFVPPEKRSIGLVFQDYALFPHLSIMDNVRFGLNAMSAEDAKLEAFTALGRVGLQSHAKAYPHELSGGEQQRVALARALVPRPAVLLMDEPFSGLDSRLKDTVRAETLGILRQSRATAIVVTHDAEEAMRMADRIALLKDGALVQVGTAYDLYAKPVSLFAAGFFSELDVFETVAKSGFAETPLGTFETKFEDGTSLSVAIRLGDIEVQDGAEIPARILSRRFLGNSELLQLAVLGHEAPVSTRVRCGMISEKSRDITVFVQKDRALVFERLNESA